MKKTVRIGSRESKLAVVQTEIVMDRIRALRPDWDLELVTMKTTGDKILNKTLDKVGGKGLFVKELHQALLRGEIDMAVHSLKDMPMEEDPRIPISAYIKRGDPRDCLVCRKPEHGENGIIGTSSARRRIQMERRGKEKDSIKSVRGNIVTRLKKLDDGAYDALILAAAGLIRAGFQDRITRYYEPEEMLPAAGQGILAVQCRAGFEPELMAELDDEDTRYAALAERGFVRALNGGCSSPVAAYARVFGDRMELEGLYYDEASGHFWKRRAEGLCKEAERLGVRLAEAMKRPGKVWLVGAGPSDPGLMTLKGKHVLEQADVVVYDQLIGDGVRQMIPQKAQAIDAGKQAGNHTMKQEAINRLLLEKALEGNRVVRLKGGDPFLFGRGGEELELLRQAGIPFEIVPGVTSAVAVPAYAGIPVTHREFASSVHIIAGHRKKGTEDIDFKGLAALRRATLIFLMGISQLEHICTGLIEAGMGEDTQAAILEKGTTSGQRRLFGTLKTLPDLAKKAQIGTPGIIVVGEVCGLGNTFLWAEKRPLHGMRIWVTRPREKNSRLAEILYDLGAEVLEAPSIQIRMLEDHCFLEGMEEKLEKYDWMAFTSQTAVEVFFDELKKKTVDIRRLGGIRIAAVGSATARALGDRGILPDFLPTHSDGETMAKELIQEMKPGEALLVFSPKQEPGHLAEELEKRGVLFDRIPLYETVALPQNERKIRGGDFFAFASASAVRGLAEGTDGEEWKGKTAVCIGKKTAKEAEKYGFSVRISKETTMESMAEAFVEIKAARDRKRKDE